MWTSTGKSRRKLAQVSDDGAAEKKVDKGGKEGSRLNRTEEEKEQDVGIGADKNLDEPPRVQDPFSGIRARGGKCNPRGLPLAFLVA